MAAQLEKVAKSYDKGIELGRKGIDSYGHFPASITNDPDYPLFQKAKAEGLDSDSGHKAVKAYLSPAANMKFIDLGCCLNLMFNGYDAWPSLYHGVDISGETIRLLRDFAVKKNLAIGSLWHGSLHETPFEADSFDIGACIGVFEYFQSGFVEKGLIEARRIMKPNGRFVLDIPDNGNPMRRLMNLLEEHLGRPCQFDMMPQAFDGMLKHYFEVDRTEQVGAVAMIRYFLRCKK